MAWRAVWSVVSLHYVCMVIGGFVWWSEQCGPITLSIISPCRRRLCVVERAVWSVVSLYCVSMVLGGSIWLGEQCGPFSLSIMSAWS